MVDASGRPNLLPKRGSLSETDEQTGRTRTVEWITPLRYHGQIVHWLEMTENGSEGQTYRNAQLLNDLCRLGDLPQKLTQDLRSTFAEVYGTLKNFAEMLRQSLATALIDPRAGPDPGTIQIRLPDPPMVYRLE